MKANLIKEKFPEIYNYPEHYGLIRGDILSPGFVIVLKQNRGLVILEELYEETIIYLLESGVDIYESYAHMLSELSKPDDKGYILNNK